MTEAVKNAYIRAERRMVAAIGLENVVIVETADAVLAATGVVLPVGTKVWLTARLDYEGDYVSASGIAVVRPSTGTTSISAQPAEGRQSSTH